MDYFTSDWHLGHRNIVTLSKRPFKSVDEMDKYIEDMVLSTAKKGDNIYFLGDIAFGKDPAIKLLEKIKKAGIYFYWILGNHDKHFDLKEFAPYCHTISEHKIISRNDKRIHMYHFPLAVWDKSYHNSFHLYGHIHKSSFELKGIDEVMQGKTLNANLEFHDYKMWSLPEVFDYMETRPDNWDYKLFLEERSTRQ